MPSVHEVGESSQAPRPLPVTGEPVERTIPTLVVRIRQHERQLRTLEDGVRTLLESQLSRVTARRMEMIRHEQTYTRSMIHTLQESALQTSAHTHEADRRMVAIGTQARDARATADSAMALAAVSLVIAGVAIFFSAFSRMWH